MRRNLLILSICLFLGACNKAPEAPRALTIQNSDGQSITLQVEIADDYAERMHGLMERQDLPDHHGMLFIFPDQDMRSFWMKNTPLFLDIIFINQDGRVVHVHPKARPYDETPISSRKPAHYVLEIKGGEAKRLGITSDSTLRLDNIK